MRPDDIARTQLVESVDPFNDDRDDFRDDEEWVTCE